MATKKIVKKSAAKKPAASKPSAKKAPAKRAPAKKAPAKKPTATSKTAARKAPTAAKKVAAPVRAVPETLRLRSVAPGFTVNDVEKSLAFYADVLGFVVRERWQRDGQLLGAELLAGDVSFYVGQDDWKKGRDRVKGVGVRLYCTTVQDIDVLASEIKARGGVLDQEPTTQSWGTRDLAVTDPDGYKITIGADLKKE